MPLASNGLHTVCKQFEWLENLNHLQVIYQCKSDSFSAKIVSEAFQSPPSLHICRYSPWSAQLAGCILNVVIVPGIDDPGLKHCLRSPQLSKHPSLPGVNNTFKVESFNLPQVAGIYQLCRSFSSACTLFQSKFVDAINHNHRRNF